MAEHDWMPKAVAWLRERANRQEQTNRESPAHAQAYPSWTERIKWWRDAAADLERQHYAETYKSPADLEYESWTVGEPEAQPMPSEGAIHPLAAAEPLQLLIDEVGRMRRALDAIYGHNEAARAAVVRHYGTTHKDISLLVSVLRARGVKASQEAQPLRARALTEGEVAQLKHGADRSDALFALNVLRKFCHMHGIVLTDWDGNDASGVTEPHPCRWFNGKCIDCGRAYGAPRGVTPCQRCAATEPRTGTCDGQGPLCADGVKPSVPGEYGDMEALDREVDAIRAADAGVGIPAEGQQHG